MNWVRNHFSNTKILSIVLSVVLSVFLVSVFAWAATTITTTSLGVATSTVGTRLGVHNGAVDIGGWTTIESHLKTSYILSTSTTASSFIGSLGVGTTTPGTSRFEVNEGWNSLLSGDAYVYGILTLPVLNATSTSATTTLAGGIDIATSSVFVDVYSGRMAIGTTTVPSVPDGLEAVMQAVDPALTISGLGGANNATGTLYIAGEGGKGGQIIIGSSDGTRCVSIIATAGANALDASNLSAATLLTTKVVACPKSQ